MCLPAGQGCSGGLSMSTTRITKVTEEMIVRQDRAALAAVCLMNLNWARGQSSGEGQKRGSLSLTFAILSQNELPLLFSVFFLHHASLALHSPFHAAGILSAISSFLQPRFF